MQDKSNKNSGEDEGGKLEPDQDTATETSLREAREAHGISVDEVAHELHLSPEVVLALEAGDYAAMGAPVFVRGHLRSYARLVGLPADKIVAGYKPYEPEPEEFRTLSAHTVVKPGASLPNFVLWSLLVLLLLVGAGYLLLGDDETAGLDDQSADFSAPRLVEEQVEPVVVVVPDDQALPESAVIEAEESPAAAAAPARPSFEIKAMDADEPVVAEEPVVEVPEVIEQPVVDAVAPATLTLRFSEECWIEISDSKRRLLYGLEKSGCEVELQGTPPFRLFIGNIGAVDIEVAGSPYTIPQSGLRGGNTARFTIAKDSFL